MRFGSVAKTNRLPKCPNTIMLKQLVLQHYVAKVAENVGFTLFPKQM